MIAADILSFVLGHTTIKDTSRRTLELKDVLDNLHDYLLVDLGEEQKRILFNMYDVYENICACSFDDGVAYGIKAANLLKEFITAPGDAVLQLDEMCNSIADTVPGAVELRREYLKTKKQERSDA